MASLGIAAEDIPADSGEAAALASDVILARGDRYSLRDLADVTGESADEIRRNFAHLGIQVDDPDRVMFDEGDIELARFLFEAVQDVLTLEEGIEILHVAATALRMLAEAAVASHIQGPERRIVDAADHVRLNAEITRLGLTLSSQLSRGFRHHLRQAALLNRRTQHLAYPELVTLTVGFLDLVGFTSLSQSMTPGELVEFVKRFEAQAHELAHLHQTRIVKLIGDEVMIVAESPTEAAEFITGMLAAFDDGRGVVPRGGLAHGDLVNIHGDYFGPVVNMAARLVDSAIPGEVLVTDAVAEEVATETAGRRMLKGFADPVSVHSLAGT
ncbi:MAG: hypothetical protein GWN79_07840 [Actinobacteria bacterium]|nr:hypothetical protein [Actinomycetota bacterium]NIS30027.1 hypothetical protein [Actinomycetota bacterium]NIT95323.1 hypothetical protein [Actinomycetota bacterium]NIU19002.1 hypothetical protein [Actinomycetota bacterium]NIU65295.1 hypothetical protein [Actinomycetota bacterium]